MRRLSSLVATNLEYGRCWPRKALKDFLLPAKFDMHLQPCVCMTVLQCPVSILTSSENLEYSEIKLC